MTSHSKRSKNEKGSALITVLFLVVILSFIILSISQTTTLAAQRAFVTRSHSELYWRAIGIEAVAQSALSTALDPSAPLTSENPILSTVYDLPMEGAQAQLAFTDQTRCFNVNSLASSNAKDASRDEMMAFAELVGIPGGDMDGLVSVVTDWIDPDDFQEPRGAEDTFYTALPTPYRTGGAPLADITEVRAMAGVKAEQYIQLAPVLCAHTSDAPTAVNVNLLTPDDAPLLAAILGKDASLADAQNIIADRPPGGYADVNAFETSATVAAFLKKPAQTNASSRPATEGGGGSQRTGGGRFAVTSKYLAARGYIEQGDMSLEFNILFEIDAGEVKVISRRIGRRI